jgi:hydrogenase maturation protease
MSTGGVLVVGLGSPDRGDDAVGLHVARALAALGDPRLDVVEHGDPTDLVELWAERDVVVVVDAVRSATGAVPGTLRLLDAGAGREPLTDDAWEQTGLGGTHAIGLATAVELARALNRLPPRLTVVGVEAAGFEHGAPLSARVAAAVPVAVAAVLEAATPGAPAPTGRVGGCARVPR